MRPLRPGPELHFQGELVSDGSVAQASTNTFVSQTSHWVGQSTEKLKSKEKEEQCKAGQEAGVDMRTWHRS